MVFIIGQSILAARIGENSKLQSAMSHQHFGERASLGALAAAVLYLALVTPEHTTTTTALHDRCQEPHISGQAGILMQDWVCSTIFSVQRGRILIFPPKRHTQILNYQILNICRVLLLQYSSRTLSSAQRQPPNQQRREEENQALQQQQ